MSLLSQCWGMVVGVLLLAGCSNASGNEKPTVGVFGGAPHVLPASHLNHECTPLTRHGHFYSTAVSGWTEVLNSGSTPVTIKRVRLTSPHNVKMTGAQVAPLPSTGGWTMLGIWAGPPRTYNAFTRQTMAEAKPAIGAKVAPGQRVQVITDLAFQRGQTATSGPVQVFYTDSDGNQHVFSGEVRFTFTAKSRCR